MLGKCLCLQIIVSTLFQIAPGSLQTRYVASFTKRVSEIRLNIIMRSTLHVLQYCTSENSIFQETSLKKRFSWTVTIVD